MGFGRNNRIKKNEKKKRRKVATDKKSQKDGLSVNFYWSNLWIIQPVILNSRYQKIIARSIPKKGISYRKWKRNTRKKTSIKL